MHLYLSTFQVIVGQTIGAITFSLVAGQPLVVVMTTAPLALFIKTIYTIAEDFEIDFLAFYGAIGLWNTFFLTIYSAFNMSVLMKFSSRSTEEIFSNFITLAFIVDSTKNMVKTFNKHYWDPKCYDDGSTVSRVGNESAGPLGSAVDAAHNYTVDAAHNYTKDVCSPAYDDSHCNPEVCFLSLILMLGTVWLGIRLFGEESLILETLLSAF